MASHGFSPSGTSEDEGFGLSSTPTQLPRLNRTRTASSTWLPMDAPPHHNQGTSYAGQPHPPPILRRNTSSSQSHTRRLPRSRSGSASHYRDDGILSEQDEADDEELENGPEERPHPIRRRDKAPVSSEDHDTGTGDEDPITTLRDRQSLINVQHPFGLPIWKPALYKKSRSVTRHADEALHSIPSAQAERHLLPGNLFWAIFFGWWLGVVCVILSVFLWLVPHGGENYSSLVFGLGWYLFWPFGKYVEGPEEDDIDAKDDDEGPHPSRWSDHGVHAPSPSYNSGESGDTIRGVPASTPSILLHSGPNAIQNESTPLIPTTQLPAPVRSYGTAVASTSSRSASGPPQKGSWIAKLCFWLALITIISPLMLFVCLICWGLVVTVPMAKLNWVLLKNLFGQPTKIRFCSVPLVVIPSSTASAENVLPEETPNAEEHPTSFALKQPRLAAGEPAPFGSRVLLCTYHAAEMQYYKYTVGGVNIMFVNLLPVVFFVIFDGFVLMPLAEKLKHHDQYIPALLAFLTSHGLIFLLSLLSIIPLSYFIGMAVASISAQSSIGMGAVINATFGSIIEIILYAIALKQSKGHLVEGSIIGSLLAGVLLMPGISMCSGALKRKEQTFNAKSASVTSMMLIMAIIGAICPTLFYQTYGNFQLVCSGCPSSPHLPGDAPWICDHCYYKHPDPADDPFYQSTVKNLMYFCAAVLVLSYLIGLWFSLRTHATQIWQNPRQLLHPVDARGSLYTKILHPAQLFNQGQNQTAATGGQDASLHHRTSNAFLSGTQSRTETPVPRDREASGVSQALSPTKAQPNVSPSTQRRVSYAVTAQPNFLPVMESVSHVVKNTDLGNMKLPRQMTTDDFTRAVAVATVSALRHQQANARPRDHDAAGGHDAPSWSRITSASVLLACTFLYALIAELLVDMVDVVLKGSGIDEKFLGITLFALVPNTTEFMNAISFAINGNIALSMEIGSAYALQVCLLQIPAMVAFSAWYDPEDMGEVAKTFTLIFPRWDVVALILSMFLMTYTYIEAKSNYHRGSILILSYLVLVSGFYFAPPTAVDIDQGHNAMSSALREYPPLSVWQTLRWYLMPKL